MPHTTAPVRALIVVDVQAIYADGPLLIEYPPVQQSLQRIGQAMDAARAAGIPIVVVQEDGFGKGSPGWQIHPVVAARHSEHRTHKTLPPAFPNRRASSARSRALAASSAGYRARAASRSSPSR